MTAAGLAVVTAAVFVVDEATDPCYLVLKGATVTELHRVCGEVDGGDSTEPDTIVVGPAGPRGLVSVEGKLGSTAADVMARNPEYLPGGRVGIAFRCGPDPDRPGFLNAESNEECCCPKPKTPACSAVSYACP